MDGMKPDDSLSRLLRHWQPENPKTASSFVADTMRELRKDQQTSTSVKWGQALADFLDAWLPAPRILLPASTCAIVLAVALLWNSVAREARSLAALEWQQRLSQPSDRISLTGAWLESRKESQ